MRSIIYMWQVSACMGIFYGFYFLLLRRLTFFTLNRWYLLVTLALSFAIPLLTITVHEQTAPIAIQKAVIVNHALPSSGFQLAASPKVVEYSIDWIQLVEIAYLIITTALLIKLLITIAQFFYRLKNALVTKVAGAKVAKGTKGINNGSFFNYIILDDENLSAQELEQVIEHEMLHVKLLHSVDRIIIRLTQVVLWFNPFVYRYAQAIEENHEFEVDREIGRNVDKGSYADMLLHLSVNRQDVLFNSFSTVPLKRRITMLFTKPTNHMKKVIYLLILPVVMISCLAFARFKNEVQTEQYSVISGVELLNDDFKVVIDGKSYDKDVVYKISTSCIKSTRITPVTPAARAKVVNYKWADAVVNVKTKNGEVVYMTEQEKENLMKERRAGFKFYTRLHLKDNNGRPFDKAIVQQLNGSASVTIQPLDKVGFLIDDVFYNENDIRFINPDKIHSLTDSASVESVKPGVYAKGIAAVFHFHTHKKPATASPAKNNMPAPTANMNKGAVIKSGVIDYQIMEMDIKAGQSPLNAPGTPFFVRSHQKNGDGSNSNIDRVDLYWSNGNAFVKMTPDTKFGAVIDGQFYKEADLKKISDEEIALLHAVGPKLRSNTFIEKGYIAPFEFRTGNAVPIDKN